MSVPVTSLHLPLPFVVHCIVRCLTKDMRPQSKLSAVRKLIVAACLFCGLGKDPGFFMVTSIGQKSECVRVSLDLDGKPHTKRAGLF